MEQKHKQQEEEDAETENEGRTREKEEKEAGKENVTRKDQGASLDVAGEALALQEEKHLLFLQLKSVLHKAKKKKKNKGKRKTEKASLAPTGLKPTSFPLDLRGWKVGPEADLWAVIQLESSVHRERRHFSS